MDDSNNHPDRTGNETNAQADAPANQETPYAGHSQTPPQHPSHSRRKRSGFAGIIISVVIVCLLIGGLVTAYIIMPYINGAGHMQPASQETPLQQADPMTPQQQQGVEGAQETVPAPTQSVDLGGQPPAINQDETAVIQIAEKVSPAIVRIDGYVRRYERGSNAVEQAATYGTGIIVSKEGYILTNSHVISGADTFKAVLSDGSQYNADIIGKDPVSDLAVLKIQADNLTAAALGNSSTLKVGQSVVAIGYPLGVGLEGTSTVTTGIISALNRSVQEISLKLIQTDAAINFGNSGGALVSLDGKVIGINTLKVSVAQYDYMTGSTLSAEGLGFAIPIDDAKPIMEQIIYHGGVKRPGIGISCYEMTEEDAEDWATPQGVMVAQLYAAGTARIAGVRRYDIITAVDGNPVKTTEDLTKYIQSKTIGSTVTLTVWRNERTMEITVEIGDLNKMSEAEEQ